MSSKYIQQKKDTHKKKQFLALQTDQYVVQSECGRGLTSETVTAVVVMPDWPLGRSIFSTPSTFSAGDRSPSSAAAKACLAHCTNTIRLNQYNQYDQLKPGHVAPSPDSERCEHMHLPGGNSAAQWLSLSVHL